PKNNKFTSLFSTCSLVNWPDVTFGRVDIMERIIEATLNTIRINVGIRRCLCVAASSCGIRFARASDIIMAFTERRMFALVSAMSLNFIWFLKVTLKRVCILLSGLLFLASAFSFALVSSFLNFWTSLFLLSSNSERFLSFKGFQVLAA